MAFVILSRGAVTESKLHTVRTRTLGFGVAALLLVMLAGGFGMGYRVGQVTTAAEAAAAAMPVPAPVTPALDESARQALIDRVGTLSGRLIRLESEAVTLARRVGTLPEVEAQIRPPQSRPPAPRPATPALEAGPSGGPLLPLLGSEDMLLPEPSAPDDHGTGLSRLEQDVERLDAAISLVAQATTDRNLEHMAFPSRAPVTGRRISSGFGQRRDPFTRQWARHTGVDIPAPRGTPILASAGGRVSFAGYRHAYGNTVEIDHGNGLKTRYAHAARLLVRAGDIVLPQQPIATVGSTGRSTGPHLHFEVLRNGVYVEPRHYLGRTTS